MDAPSSPGPYEFAFQQDSATTQSVYAYPRGGGTPLLLIQSSDPSASLFLAAFDTKAAYCVMVRDVPTDGSPPTGQQFQLLSVPLTGGAPQPIGPPTEEIGQIAVDATSLYMIDVDIHMDDPAGGGLASSIKKIPLTGGTFETLVTGESSPQRMVLAGGFVYWTDSLANLRRIPTSGGPIETLGTNLVGGGFVADSTGFYWATPGMSTSHWFDGCVYNVTIQALLNGSSAPTTLLDGLSPISSLVVLDGTVYFTYYGPSQCPDGGQPVGTASGQIARLKPGATAPETLASQLGQVVELFVNASSIYFLTASHDNGPFEMFTPHVIPNP